MPDATAPPQEHGEVELEHGEVVPPREIVTIILIAINILFFLWMVIHGVSFFSPTGIQVLRWGADSAQFSLGGQFWRLLASNYIHLGIIHLLINMVCLWGLGRLAETFYATNDYILLYTFTGLCSSLLSVCWKPHEISAGASGAIFGITGVMLATLQWGRLDLTPESKEQVFSGVLQFTVLNLFIGGAQNFLPGILHRQVDNAGHIGGLLSGLLVGALFGKRLDDSAASQAYRKRAWLVLFFGLAVALMMAVYRFNGVTIHVRHTPLPH